jgi:hypothetical protein
MDVDTPQRVEDAPIASMAHKKTLNAPVSVSTMDELYGPFNNKMLRSL